MRARSSGLLMYAGAFSSKSAHSWGVFVARNAAMRSGIYLVGINDVGQSVHAEHADERNNRLLHGSKVVGQQHGGRDHRGVRQNDVIRVLGRILFEEVYDLVVPRRQGLNDEVVEPYIVDDLDGHGDGQQVEYAGFRFK